MTTGFRPIFIVGVPRSGTTLLRVILNRHPNIAIADETYFFYYVHARRRAFGDLAREANRRRLVKAYLETWRIARLGLEREKLATRLVREGTSYSAFFASLMSAYAESRSKQRPGEKTPQHASNVETLLEWFPGATVVHVVRDPRDVVASLQNVPWGHRSTAANARLWVSLVKAVRRTEGHAGCLTVRYEDLVNDPESCLRSLCEGVEEPYVRQLLSAPSHEMADRPWFRRAYQPITASRVGFWRKDLRSSQARIVERIAGSLMRAYGYEPIMSPASVWLRVGADLYRSGESCRRTVLGLPRIWNHRLRPTDLAAEEARIDGGASHVVPSLPNAELRHFPPADAKSTGGHETSGVSCGPYRNGDP